jgi:hypothetical protein
MTSQQGTNRDSRTAVHGRDSRIKALGALAGLALTAGFVVTAGGPASARNCDVGVSVCQAAQAHIGHLSRNYP